MKSMQIFYLVMIFLAVASGVLGIVSIMFRPRVATERLLGGAAGSPTAGNAEPVWQAKAVKLAEPIAKLVLPGDTEALSQLRLRFLNAGFRSRAAMPVFFASKVVLTLLVPFLMLVYFGLSNTRLGPDLIMTWVLIGAAIGFFLPNFILNRAVTQRQRHLFETFPDAVDLLVVCMEAGLGLDAAITRAAEEMRVRSPELADELYLVTLELRVGATREQALRNLAMRTGLEEVASLATMLIQADRFGTNVADALRVHADSQRVHRHMLAEEAAAKVAVKLVFPVVLCIFPALMLVLGGPPFITIYRNLLPMMG